MYFTNALRPTATQSLITRPAFSQGNNPASTTIKMLWSVAVSCCELYRMHDRHKIEVTTPLFPIIPPQKQVQAVIPICIRIAIPTVKKTAYFLWQRQANGHCTLHTRETYVTIFEILQPTKKRRRELQPSHQPLVLL